MKVLKVNQVDVIASPDVSIREVYSQPGSAQLTWLQRAEQFGYLFLGTVESLILFRFFLVMFDVDRASGFARWLLGVTDPLVSPFIHLFGSRLTAGRAVFEFPDLVAILVYALGGLFCLKLGRLIFEPTRKTSV